MLESAELVIWNGASERLSLQAGICCRYSIDEGQVFASVESGYNIPISPLNGTHNKDVTNVIKACLAVDKSHEHNIDNWALSNILKRLNGKLHKAVIVVFSKIDVGSEKFCFLGFPENNVHEMSLQPPTESVKHYPNWRTAGDTWILWKKS